MTRKTSITAKDRRDLRKISRDIEEVKSDIKEVDMDHQSFVKAMTQLENLMILEQKSRKKREIKETWLTIFYFFFIVLIVFHSYS